MPREEKVIYTSKNPQEILFDPLYNKGTGFTQEERDNLGLNGLLPFHLSSIEEQAARRYDNFKKQKDEISRYMFLSALQDRNETLFYRLVHDHIEEMVPYIYTPTVGEASIQYSYLYNQNRGIYIPFPLKDKMEEIIDNIPRDDIQVIVVTDGERILGLGDLGAGGMLIPVGKLSLYTLFGGISPFHTLPVLLDVGTNNKKLLEDPLYLGWRHERIRGELYEDFIETFVSCIKKRYPKVLLQWEDFAKPHAKALLQKYQNRICSFNDDIQGTAAVTLAAIWAAAKKEHHDIRDQKIVIVGGGSAGLGIANYILEAMKMQGIKESEAKKNIYIIDIHGLIQIGHKNLWDDQKKFAKDPEEWKSWQVENPQEISLLEVIKNVHPNVLIGVCAQPNFFTQEIITEMARHTEKPIIFPLSNPTSKAEASFEDIIRWTDGKAIVATGSPFPPVEYKGTKFQPSQCNNVYIFPGVGLGIVASKAKAVTDDMFIKAAEVLSRHAPILENDSGPLFPSFCNLRMVSREIAIAVAQIVFEKGLQTNELRHASIAELVDDTMWQPAYATIRKSIHA
ncbi:MAG: NAD-dependent malic enzyme [Simkaniaceae bacterium]